MLIRPRTLYTDYLIDRMVFIIPDDFAFPSEKDFDACTIQGTVNLAHGGC